MSINSLSFANDLVIFSESHKGLQTALNKLDSYCFKWQLTVNIKKNKNHGLSEEKFCFLRILFIKINL
jgi:hypothetical protein